MKRFALLTALLVSASTLSGCGLATNMAGSVTRLAESAGRLVGVGSGT